MVKEKGLQELFEAISIIIEQSPNVYLLHVGFVDRSRNDAITPNQPSSWEYPKIVGFLACVSTSLNFFPRWTYSVCPATEKDFPCR